MKIDRIHYYLKRPTLYGDSPGYPIKLARIARAVKWISLQRLGHREATCPFRHLGLRLCFPVGSGVATELFVLRDDYEVEVSFLIKALYPGMIFLDIGANFGLYSLVASRLVGSEGLVLAVEPNPVVMEYLTRNIQLNLANNVFVLEKALSNEFGKKFLWIHAGDPFGSSSLAKSDLSTKTMEVEATTLDALCGDLPRLDLVKVDVEGWEARVLQGGLRTLRRWRPMVIFEVSPRRCEEPGVDQGEALSILEMCGYEFFVLNGTNILRIGRRELATMLSSIDRVNVIAVSREKNLEAYGVADSRF